MCLGLGSGFLTAAIIEGRFRIRLGARIRGGCSGIGLGLGVAAPGPCMGLGAAALLLLIDSRLAAEGEHHVLPRVACDDAPVHVQEDYAVVRRAHLGCPGSGAYTSI